MTFECAICPSLRANLMKLGKIKIKIKTRSQGMGKGMDVDDSTFNSLVRL